MVRGADEGTTRPFAKKSSWRLQPRVGCWRVFGEARREWEVIQSTAWMDEEEGVGKPLNRAGAMALIKVSRSPRYVPEIEKDWPSRWTPKPSLPSTTDALRAKS